MAPLTLGTEAAPVFVILLMTSDTGGRGFHLLVHTLAVAGVAIEPFMASVQLELGSRIVIEIPDLPVACVMAITALSTKPASVRIICLVAGIARRGRLVRIQGSSMTFYTSRHTMLTDKRVLGVTIMIKENRFPFLLVMTFLAFQTKVGSMNIVFLVARVALGRGLFFIETACVATIAFCLAMVPLESIRRIPIMLKKQNSPVPFRVTTLTPFAISTLMFVVFLVASVAIHRRLVLIEMSFMARAALGEEVTPFQWILCV